MSTILKIARREYAESVKSKTFILSIVFAPLLIGAMIFFIGRPFETPTSAPPLKVALTDLSGEFEDELNASFEAYNNDANNRQIILEKTAGDLNLFESISAAQKDKLRGGRLDTYIVIEPNVVSGDGKISAYTYQTKASEAMAPDIVVGLCSDALKEYRYKAWNVDRSLFAKITRVETQEIEIGQRPEEEKVKGFEDKIVTMLVPFFFMYLMFLGIFVNGQQMLTSILEEKSSRIIEVLLSAVSPFELMTGKIVGRTAVGLTIVSIWAGAAVFGARWMKFNIEMGPLTITYFIIYFVLGFILFNALMAGIGSVCNTLKDAQNLMTPVTLVCIIPLMSWMKIVNDPSGVFSRVLSFLPPTTSMVMVLRLSADSDIGLPEVLATIIVLALSVWAFIWMAARVFRTGILMYGKRPRIREMFRWLIKS